MPEQRENADLFVRLLIHAHKLALVYAVNDASEIIAQYFIP